MRVPFWRVGLRRATFAPELRYCTSAFARSAFARSAFARSAFARSNFVQQVLG